VRKRNSECRYLERDGQAGGGRGLHQEDKKAVRKKRGPRSGPKRGKQTYVQADGGKPRATGRLGRLSRADIKSSSGGEEPGA